MATIKCSLNITGRSAGASARSAVGSIAIGASIRRRSPARSCTGSSSNSIFRSSIRRITTAIPRPPSMSCTSPTRRTAFGSGGIRAAYACRTPCRRSPGVRKSGEILSMRQFSDVVVGRFGTFRQRLPVQPPPRLDLTHSDSGRQRNSCSWKGT